MIKKTLLTILMSMTALGASAQLKGDGFYRVKNVVTERYISVIDNKGSIDKSSTQGDLGAIQTIKYFERVATDPGSVIYIKKMGSEYDLVAQGTSVYGIVGITIQLLHQGGNIYQAFKSAQGFSRYLFDLSNVNREVGKVLTNGEYSTGTQNWYIQPITDEDQYYLAVQPSIKQGNYYYQTCYASYGYNFNNPDDKAFYISKMEDNIAVYKEIVGSVPTATPVIIRGNSNVVSEHKLTPLITTPTTITGNQLTGTYFCSSVTGHINRISNDATIRVLGILSDGSLGFKRDTENKYIPHNTAYLKVSDTAPEEIKLMSEEAYNAWKEEEQLRKPVTLTAVNITREYGEVNPELTYTVNGTLVGGEPVLSCEATASSPVGTYPITVNKGSVKNLTPTLVNGTLTITPAPLKVKVGEYTREYGEENPAFDIQYEGWKNGETASNLTAQASVNTDAVITSNAGDYNLTLSGATSQNYAITYEHGKLTVTPATLTVKAIDMTRTYGENNPNFTLSYSGWKNGDTPNSLSKQPEAQTEATKTSHVGVYDITLSGAESQNYTFNYVNGKLTVTPADLTIRADNKTREYGEINPTFTWTYMGLKNNDTPASLAKLPEVLTDATQASHVGEYELKLVNAEAQDYTFTYINGTLTITPAPLTISVGNYKREQGQENPVITPVYEGFKNNDSAESLTQQPTITLEATVDSPVGIYPIYVSGAESADYTITYIQGSLEVDVPSAIHDISGSHDRDIYTLNGTRVNHQNSQTTTLRKGIYVINGRKVVVK